MATAPLPHDERERLRSLLELGVLDTPPDPLFDSITELAAQVCDVPIALISLVDGQRQWFKSNLGLPGITQTPRDVAFCAHAILCDGLMEVPDALHDVRFHDNPLVTGEPRIRFYAGMPLRDAKGLVLGTVCVIDREPRCLTDAQRGAIEQLSRLAVYLLEQRRSQRQASDQLAQLSQFDSLTGLPNRHLFRDRVAQSLVGAERHGVPMAVVALNLDGFKLVNGNHGHAAGDRLLVQVAERLQCCVRAGDSVSRRGADEFGVVLADLGRAEDTATVVGKFLTVLSCPFDLDGTEVFISASAGVSLFDADGTDADVLIRHAEIALQRAKEQGRNTQQFYAPDMNLRVEKRMKLESSLRHALGRGEFTLHYQAKVGLAQSGCCGVEALLRWNHPTRGQVGPQEFIPILEDTGLILPVGLWVLETACAQLRAWQDSGLSVPSVAINLSAVQFRQVDLDTRVRDIIAASGIDPSRVELEITESMLMHDPEQATLMLTKLRHLGVRLSVDDFGTGYSSLAYLKQFPLDALKIDRAFIRNITHDLNDAAIALAIINLAHHLNLKVVAEGVETEAQARFLIAHGCDALQGFYFARPVDADACAALIRDGRQLALPTPVPLTPFGMLEDTADA